MRIPLKVLFLAKKDHKPAMEALEFLRTSGCEAEACFLRKNEAIPDNVLRWEGDLILSYLFPKRVPQEILRKSDLGGLNWHPGTPEYPGIGCTNFAIYEGAKEYGITCHRMEPRVDCGEIIEVRKFAVAPEDNVYSLTMKCYDLISESFRRVIQQILDGEFPRPIGMKWSREPFTRKDLDALCEIRLDMKGDEIEKRIRSTTFDRVWAWINLDGRKFPLDMKQASQL